MTAERLGVAEFGRILVESGDIDPLYFALVGTRMPRAQLARWLVCYWCYYNAGLSCWASEQEEWTVLDKIARGGTDYPRGSERRHFRGAFAVESVRRLREQFTDAEEMLEWLVADGYRATAVMARIKGLYGFGEWIKWKVPDMLERLGLYPIEFVEGDVRYMFDSSLKGAYLVHEKHATRGNGQSPTSKLLWAHRYVLQTVEGLKAPPQRDRALNVQETETIFCKWKSHLGGHYPLYKDTHEIYHGLARYEGACVTARRMRKAMRDVFGGLLGRATHA